jgi:hypothetical protein
MKTIKIVDVDIDIHDGPIGIGLSGGADSSLLFYILLKYSSGPVHVFSCGNGRTSNHEPISALKIINRCIALTGRRDIYFYAHWVEVKNINTGINRNILSQLKLPILYNGLTRPPPAGAIENFDNNGECVGGVDHGMTLPSYWNGKDSELFKRFFDLKIEYGEELNLYTPFININKKKIAELYKELKIEHLYPATRSCESLIYDTGHCGTCWWCKERIWGFGYLE